MIGNKKLIEDLRVRYLDSNRLNATDITQLKAEKNKRQIELIDIFVAALADDRIDEAEKHRFRRFGVFNPTVESFDLSWTAWAKTNVAKAKGQELVNLTKQAVTINNFETSFSVFTNLPSMILEDFATKKNVVKHFSQQCVSLCQEVSTKNTGLIQLLAYSLSSSLMSNLSTDECRELGMIVVNALKQIPLQNSKPALLEMTRFYYGDNDHRVSSAAAEILLQNNRQETVKVLIVDSSQHEQTVAALIALSQVTLAPNEVDLLLNILRDPNETSEMKGYSAVALGNLPSTTTQEQYSEINDALFALVETSTNSKPVIQALESLGKTGDANDFSRLKPYFFNEDINIQIASIDAWSSIQSRPTNFDLSFKQDAPKTLKYLALSSSTNVNVRQHALSALISVYHTAALPTLLKCLSDQTPEMRSYAKGQLHTMAQETLNDYSDALAYADSKTYVDRKLTELERLKTRLNLAIQAFQKTSHRSEAQNSALASLREALHMLNGVAVAQSAHK